MKRKLLSTLLVLAMVLSIVPAITIFASAAETPDTSWYTNAAAEVGSTEANPYIIKNTSQLEGLAAIVNGGTATFENKFIKLDDNFDGSVAFETPIGDRTNQFKGTFDGNGKNVKLNINVPGGENIGMFGYFSVGKIKNLSTSGTVIGSINVGGIVGNIDENGTYISTVINCQSSADVSGTNRVGGIAGANSCEVLKCNSNGSVNSVGTGTCYIGGIVGHNYGTVDSCGFSGELSSDLGQTEAGCVVGTNAGGKITNCYSTGSITINPSEEKTYYISAGGIVGNTGSTMPGGIIQNCYSLATIYVNNIKQSYIGGIAGLNLKDSVINCFSACSITWPSSGSTKGGVIGANDNKPVSNCYYLESDTYHGIGSEASDTANTLAMSETNMKKASGSDSLVDKLNTYSTSDDGKAAGCKKWTVGASDGYPTFYDPDTSWYTDAAAEVGSTEANPYIIKNTSQLEGLAKIVDEGTDTFENKFIKLDDNFDGSVAFETPIGDKTNQFKGTFDGNGKNVKLNINYPTGENVGMFGYNGGTIKNLSTSGTVTGSINVGGIVGYNSSKVIECKSDCTVNLAGSTTSRIYVGGLIGYNSGTVDKCSFSGEVLSVSEYNNTYTYIFAGGIAGINNDGTIKNTYSIGTITVQPSKNILMVYAGGIAGVNQKPKYSSNNTIILNCYSLASLSIQNATYSYMGGIAGMCSASDIKISYTSCDMTSDADTKTIGGIAGMASSVFSCYYIENTSYKGIGDKENDDTKYITVMSESDMKLPYGDNSLVKKLNNDVIYCKETNPDCVPWTVIADENEGYPQFAEPVAEAEGKLYYNIEDAIKAAEVEESQAAKTVKLIADVNNVDIKTKTFEASTGNHVIIDLNGFKVFSADSKKKGVLSDDASAITMVDRINKLVGTTKTVTVEEMSMTEADAKAIVGYTFSTSIPENASFVFAATETAGKCKYIQYTTDWQEAAEGTLTEICALTGDAYVIGDTVAKDKVTLTTDMAAEITYTGEAVADPTVTAKIGEAEKTPVMGYEFKYYTKGDTTFATAITPTDVGEYVLRVKVNGSDPEYYSEATSVAFKITKATNTVSDLAIEGWTYGGTPKSPTASALTGDITYKYKLKTDGDDKYSEAVPTNAGTYTLRATSEATDNYNADSQTVEFTIAKAKNTITGLAIADWTKGEDASTPSITNTASGDKTVTYEYKVRNAADSTYKSFTTAPTEAGVYVLRAKSADTTNYEADYATVIFVVKEADDTPDNPDNPDTPDEPDHDSGGKLINIIKAIFGFKTVEYFSLGEFLARLVERILDIFR